MTLVPTEYELEVLREIHEPGSGKNLRWGAGMSVALEYLQGSGYVTRGPEPKITKKGLGVLGRYKECGGP